MEVQFVEQVQNIEASMNMASGYVGMIPVDPIASIAQQIKALQCRTQETDQDLHRMQEKSKVSAINSHECTELNTQLQHLAIQARSQHSIDQEEQIRGQKELPKQFVSHEVTGLSQLWLTLADKLKDTVAQLDTLQSKILDELMRWKRYQQLAGNGASFDSNLDSIQEWCQSLVKMVWHTRHQIKEAERLTRNLALDYPGVQDILPALNSQITQLLSLLVTNTFIIEEQPPQVIKINTRFASKVRLLVSGNLNDNMPPPQVTVNIINQAQARVLLDSNNAADIGRGSGDISHNTQTMEYEPATRQLSASFNDMQLRKMKRAKLTGSESLMEEKFALLFQSQFGVEGGELVFRVWTLSLPISVIVKSHQEPLAWATITWDNAVAEPGRVPFAVPDRIPWARVAEALNLKFRSVTGRSLTDGNLQVLGEKAFRDRNSGRRDHSRLLLSWAQFCKEPLPSRSFTFWEWFYAVMKLTSEYLLGPWFDGYIIGFVRRKQAEDMLASCTSGTFLLRFSESQLGRITIAAVGNGTRVFMLQPFNGRDLAIRSLADRISDIPHLMYLYPELSKDLAFSRYYTSNREDRGTSSNGYVQLAIITPPVLGKEYLAIASQTSPHSSSDSVGGGNQDRLCGS